MEHFFNNDFKTQDIAKTWKTRKAELRAEELQSYSDMLFKYLHDDILSRREQIFCDLEVAVRYAHGVHQLAIPLWTYNEIKFRKCTPHYYMQLADVQRRGLDWTISNRENTRSESVGEVIRKTDLCARLSLMFGPDYVIRDVRHSYVDSSDDWVANRRLLTLVYRPRGPSPWQAGRKNQAYQRFGNTMPEGNPVLYTGEEPGFSNVTPPPPPARDDPPPVVRSNAGVVPSWGDDPLAGLELDISSIPDAMPAVRRTDSFSNYWGGTATCYCNCDKSDNE